MTGLTWTSLQTTLLAALTKSQPPYNVVPPDFAALYPQAITYAEGRIYKELVLLATRTFNTSLVTTPGARGLLLSAISPPVVVPESVSLLTPAGSVYTNGTQQQFDESSLDIIDMTWPQASVTMAPDAATWIGRRWALQSEHAIVLAPTPDAVYTVVLIGLFQPPSLSAGNPTTYLSTIYPELLTAACMVFLTGGLTHNYGAQGDDPRSAISWESQYVELRATALHEEMRRRGLVPDVAAPPAPPSPA